ncbi:MAG: hypothetical protein K8S62_14240 [Candidatus Sabulitectum sp.]|nr:hypothetical protein [Candidatus Sabulitectum sp.]
MKWLVIVNKKAGGGSAGGLWISTENSLIAAGIDYTARFTEAPAQTRLIASNALNFGFDGIAVFGGDGTISDAAAAISPMIEKPVLAFLPAGSGNDWMRSMGCVPVSMDSCIKAIASEKTKLIDSGMCVWPGGSRFFLNSAGVGFDALVLKRTVAGRRFLPFNQPGYLLTLAVSALFPPHWRATVYCDGKPFYKGDYLTITTGVGRYSGGGMLLSPCAAPDDGFLDTLCLSPMNFFSIAGNFSRIFDGTLHKTKWATGARGKVIRIEHATESSIILELDGEIVVPGVSPDYIEFISRPEDLLVIDSFSESH